MSVSGCESGGIGTMSGIMTGEVPMFQCIMRNVHMGTPCEQNDKPVKILPSCNFVKSLVIGGSRGGRARRAPPHLPGILVFDDILGHIV